MVPIAPPLCATAAAAGGLSFVITDRIWWFALLAACYRRPPSEVLAAIPRGHIFANKIHACLGTHRVAKIVAWLDVKAGQFATSGPGVALRCRVGVDPKRLVLILPQSIALYNLSLPLWLPFNGWLAAATFSYSARYTVATPVVASDEAEL
eukprot:CAMPEP_0117502240 /NCGR_PEP_ID=MMETSP0784-20121206/23711_1 /TAXON_ID=39447 /ORGANISM="" /LENGTH=150 /DNA_ID=CAMNT_0005297517 /DNA_START=135 /DNA_END=587 /DNA_ORIENTATION=+